MQSYDSPCVVVRFPGHSYKTGMLLSLSALYTLLSIVYSMYSCMEMAHRHWCMHVLDICLVIFLKINERSNFKNLFWFISALGDLTITYLIEQQPSTAEGNASAVAIITSNWEFSIVSTDTFAGYEDQGESCRSTPSSEFKSINLTCNDLHDDTYYIISIEALVHLINETYPLKFSVLFHTDANLLTHSSKLHIYTIKNTCIYIYILRTLTPVYIIISSITFYNSLGLSILLSIITTLLIIFLLVFTGVAVFLYTRFKSTSLRMRRGDLFVCSMNVSIYVFI